MIILQKASPISLKFLESKNGSHARCEILDWTSSRNNNACAISRGGEWGGNKHEIARLNVPSSASFWLPPRVFPRDRRAARFPLFSFPLFLPLPPPLLCHALSALWSEKLANRGGGGGEKKKRRRSFAPLSRIAIIFNKPRNHREWNRQKGEKERKREREWKGRKREREREASILQFSRLVSWKITDTIRNWLRLTGFRWQNDETKMLSTWLAPRCVLERTTLDREPTRERERERENWRIEDRLRIC